MSYRHGLDGLFAVLLGLLSHNAARADLIFAAGLSRVGEYTTSGATVNSALISGLSFPVGIAVSGSNLFVVNRGNGTVGEYTTAGATVNPALISGLSDPVGLDIPYGIAVSGSDLFVFSGGNGTIGEYTTSGATVNPALISGLDVPYGIAVSGSDLFVVNYNTGTIGKYTTSGTTVNPALISGLSVSSGGIAVSGSDLFFLSGGYGTIGEYTTSGATVNPALISGLFGGYAITVVATVPEPGSCTLALFGLLLAGLAIKKIEKKWHKGCGWAYQSDEKTDTHGPHLPGLVAGIRPFAHFLAYGVPILIFMTAWAILLIYTA
jgi:PEP-CTERM motif